MDPLRRVFLLVPIGLAAGEDRVHAMIVQNCKRMCSVIDTFSAAPHPQWSTPVKCCFVAACLAFFAGGGALAQVTGMALPTPTVGTTSPLGSTTGTSMSPVGIGLGATELPSPGISPAPVVTGSIATPSTGTACSTLGLSPSGMFGSTSTYDGGGMAMAGSTPATGGMAGNTAASIDPSSGIAATTMSGMTQSSTSATLDTAGMSGMCGSGSSSVAASSSPTSTAPTTPGGNARTGIPLASTEISNLGVSSAALLPTPAVPIAPGSIAAIVPTMPAAAATSAVSPSITTP